MSSEYIVNKSEGAFEIRIEGSKKKYSLPAWNNIPARVALDAHRAAKSSDDESAGVVLMDYIDTQCPGLLDIVSQEQLLEIVTAWQGSGASLGE